MRLTATSLVIFAACGATVRPAVPPAPHEGGSFVLTNVRVFDGEHTFEHRNVVVRDGRIASLGAEPPPSDLSVLDGTGRTVFPGLIDAHAHVQTEVGLRNALRFGVTTLLDMFTRVEFMQAHRAQRDRLTRTDLADLYSAGNPITSPGGMGTQFGIPFATIEGPEEASAFVRARLAEGSAYIKILFEPEAGIVTTISAETLAAAVRAAHEQGALTAVHITTRAGARAAVAAGADGLAHLFGDQPIDDQMLHEMVAQHMFVTATLSAHAYVTGHGIGPELAADPRVAPFLTAAERASLLGPAPSKDSPMAPYLARFDLAQASETVRRLHLAGVPILAGDDAANFGPHGISLLGELELLTRAGLTPAEALTAATLAPAKAFKLADRGRIAPGARADLVIVDGNPLVDITATRAIFVIVKNGYEVPRSSHTL